MNDSWDFQILGNTHALKVTKTFILLLLKKKCNGWYLFMYVIYVCYICMCFMYVCFYVCIYIFMYLFMLCMYVCMLFINLCIYVCMYVCYMCYIINIYLFSFFCVCINICYLCLYECYLCMYICMYVCYICYVMNIYLFSSFFSLWVYHIWEYYRKCFSFSDDDTITRHGRFRKDEEEVRYEWFMRFPDTWKHSCFKGNKNIYITTIKKKM